MVYSKMRYSFISPLFMLGLFLLTSCENEDSMGYNVDNGIIPDSVSFSADIQKNIFTKKCAFSGCHAGTTPQQGMRLEAGAAFTNIVNVPSMERPAELRIFPGSPDKSYLYRKLIGENIDGSQMPLTGGPLSSSQINIIKKWIEEGAENN